MLNSKKVLQKVAKVRKKSAENGRGKNNSKMVRKKVRKKGAEKQTQKK